MGILCSPPETGTLRTTQIHSYQIKLSGMVQAALGCGRSLRPKQSEDANRSYGQLVSQQQAEDSGRNACKELKFLIHNHTLKGTFRKTDNFATRCPVGTRA